MKRKRRGLTRGNKIYLLGPPPPRRQPVIDHSVPSTYEQYVDERDERERLAARDRLLVAAAAVPGSSTAAGSAAPRVANVLDDIDGPIDRAIDDGAVSTGPSEEEPQS